MENNKKPSEAFVKRQTTREPDGQYKKMNRCEICNKGLGDYNYYSDERCDTDRFHKRGLGLILCKKDALILEDMEDETAYNILLEAEAKRQ